jgi:hypothetical protein
METFENHYLYGHAVDDHHKFRHSNISLEETWVTHRWVNRVFAFVLAITEVNVFLAMRYFVWRHNKAPLAFLQFCRELAKALTYNPHMEDDTMCIPAKKSKPIVAAVTEHDKQTAPHHAKLYDGSKWIIGARDPYQRYTCKDPRCRKRVRTYCSCSVGYWRCFEHYCQHKIDCERARRYSGVT